MTNRRRRSVVSFCLIRSDSSAALHLILMQSATPTSSSLRQRACDRCYAGKERCTYSESSKECDRCLRLSHSCVQNRPVQRPGRKPRSKTVAATPASSDAAANASNFEAKPDSPLALTMTMTPASAVSFPDVFFNDAFVVPTPIDPFLGLELSDLKPHEELCLRRILDKTWFSQYMVVAPHFADEQQTELTSYLLSAFDLMKDGYIACYSAFSVAMGFELEGFDHKENLSRGALVVQKLRSSSRPRPDELLPWICLGLAIVTFAQCALGTDATPVRRHVLSYVNTLGDSAIEYMHNPMVVCLTTLEINECLVRRQIPILRPQAPDQPIIDRYMGLSLSLLPLLYDVCKLSNELKTADEFELPVLLDVLEDVRRSVESWQPIAPDNFIDDFTAMEVSHMCTQSRAYQTAALLYIHRLKSPFNSGDDLGGFMSRSILSDLELARRTTGRAPRYVTMPFILAAIEAKTVEDMEKAIEWTDLYVDNTSPRTRANVKAFLSALWCIRDSSTGFGWLDLVEHVPSLTISI